MSTTPLKDRIALITGASAGIGEATARHLASQGCKLVLNARREERLRALADSLPKGQCVIAPGDAAEQAVIDRALDAARSAFSRDADLIVVNAGRGLNGSVITSDPAQWDEMVRTNLMGCARLLRSAAQRLLHGLPTTPLTPESPWLKVQRDIVLIGSVVGRHVSPFSSMYGSTKFAVHALAEGARRELGPKGIRVSLVEPGFVISEFQGVAGYDDAWFESMKQKFAPMLNPSDVANAVSFIAQQPAHVHISDLLLRPTRQDYP